jgi:hypothetical protein
VLDVYDIDLALTVPDQAINRKAVELECTGIPGQIYEIQVSDGFNNWFTVQTFFGTGGLVRIPVSADSDKTSASTRPCVLLARVQEGQELISNRPRASKNDSFQGAGHLRILLIR